MGCIKLSNEAVARAKLSLDNLFVLEFLPFAPENFLKVYLYGLCVCNNINLEPENDLDKMARRLNLDTRIIVDAFLYWQEQGLVNIYESEPFSVEYLPVRPVASKIKKFNKEKYKDFNEQLIKMLPSRNILPNEFNEYYTAIETLHLEQAAMLSVIAYCIRLKGEDINYRYILTVARNLANDGATTFDAVNEKLNEIKLYENDILEIFKALKIKRKIEHDDKDLFIKFTKKFGFSLDVIIFVAKSFKKGGLERLDNTLTKYYSLGLLSKGEITNYVDTREQMYELAKEINKRLGLYYEQLDSILEEYTAKWLNLGFDAQSLQLIATYCLKQNIRTLNLMNDIVLKFYKQGLLTVSAINDFIFKSNKTDENIKVILENLGIVRVVTSKDRDLYRTWTYLWRHTDELILYACTLAAGKANATAYLNSILAAWFEKNITTVIQAKQSGANVPQAQQILPKAIANTMPNVVMTSEQLNALFDNLDPKDM